MYATAKNIARAIVQRNESVRRTGAWAAELALGSLDDHIIPRASFLPLSGTVQRVVHFAREEVASLFEPTPEHELEPEHELRRKVERERDVLILVLSHVLSHDTHDTDSLSPTAAVHSSYSRPSLLSSYHLSKLDVLSEEEETEEEGESTSVSESSSTSSTDMMNSESPVPERSATTRPLSNKSILKSQQPSSPQRITSQRRVQFAAQTEPSPSPEPVQQPVKPRRKPAPALAPHPYQLAFNKRKQFWLPPKAHVQSPTIVQPEGDEGRTDVAIAELVQ